LDGTLPLKNNTCVRACKRSRPPGNVLTPLGRRVPLVKNHYVSSDVPESFFSSQSRVRVTSPSSQSHLKFCRVESWLGRVTRMVE